MDRFVKSLLQTIDEEEKKNNIREFKEVSGISYLLWRLKSDDKEGVELIRGLFSWLPHDIEGGFLVLEILDLLNVESPGFDEVVLLGVNFLGLLTKKLLRDFQEQITEYTSYEREEVSKDLLQNLLFLVRDRMFGVLFVNEFEFCIDSLVSISVNPSNLSQITTYMRILEILYRLPKDNSTASRFETFLNYKLSVIASLCPIILTEEHRWVLEIGSEFRRTLAYHLVPAVQGGVIGYVIKVDRNSFLKSSMDNLLTATPDNLRMGVSVEFSNEAGRGTGVLRHWLALLAHKMVNSEELPFETSGEDLTSDRSRIYPRRGSAVDPIFYRLFGRLIGLAIIHKVQIGYTLDKVVFLQLSGRTVTLEGIKETLPCKYKYYKELFVMNKSTLRHCHLFFTSDLEGTRIIPPGRVTVGNVVQYVAHRIDLELVDGIRNAISQLLKGLDDVLTAQCREHLFEVLQIQDFDLILKGIQDLEIEEWRRYTTYDGYDKDDPQIMWFWDCVGDMSAQEQRDFLHFWTSIVWLPAGGFKDLDPPL